MGDDKKLVVLTAVGSDHPGLVSELSTLIHEQGANIEDSRMAVLGGEFALVLLFSGSTDIVARVVAESAALGQHLELALFFKPTAVGVLGEALAYRLQVSGLDHPGIVQRVTNVLSRFKINVASLDTCIVNAPMTGTPTFVLKADVDVPSDVPVSEAREALESTCEQANLDCILEARV